MRSWLVFLNIILTLPGCQTLQPAPKQPYPVAAIWNGKIYMGDSNRLGVAQSLTAPVIGCREAAFDRLICMSIEDYTALMQYFILSACVNQ